MTGLDREKTLDRVMEWFIWGIIFCLPFSKSLVEIFVSLAFFLWIFKKVKARDILLKSSPIILAFGLYFLVNFLSLFWSTSLSLSFRALFSKVLEYIILFFIIYEFIDTEKKLKRIFFIIIISICLITINGLIQQFYTGYDLLHYYPAFSLTPTFRGFVTSSFPFPNDYAAWIITLLPLCLILSFFGLKEFSKRNRILVYIATVLLMFSLFLTKVRGAWLAFFAGLIVLGFLKSRKIVIVFLLIASVFYIFSPSEFKNAIKSTVSFKDRIEMWENSVKMFRDRPLRGFGLNTFYENYKLYRKDKYKYKKGSYAHNCYLQQAVEVGIPGLLIFLYLLFCIFKIPFKAISKSTNKFSLNLALGIWIGLLNFCIYAFFDTNFYSLPLVILFWFMAGLLFSINNLYGKTI